MGMVKDEAKKLIDQLPEEITWDDIMYEIYARKKIENALKAVEEGKVVSHEEARKRLLNQ
jgi:predicted transcriptional regulator